MAKTNHKTGFTIVELLIVIVVIAIIAAITVIAYNGIQNRAHASDAKAALNQAEKKLKLYEVTNGSYPLTGNLAAADISNNGAGYQYTSTDGSGYCITATSGNVSYYAKHNTTSSAGA